MAQLSIREYLTSECKKENIVLRFHLAMVKKAHLDIQENLSESEESECQCNSTEAGCVVDGILQQETRGSFKKDKECQVLIQSLHQTTICPENIKPIRRRGCLSSSTSDDITIYYYKSNMLEDLEKGVPVVLNISNSNQFLKCTFRSDKAVLTVEASLVLNDDLDKWGNLNNLKDYNTNLADMAYYYNRVCWEKDKLDSIYKNDPTTWPFVFYLTCTKDNCRRFESAECSGWFIHTESNYVCMAEQKDKDKDSEKYSFLILRSPNTTKSK